MLIPAITPPVFQFSVLNSSTPPPVPDHQNTLALSTPQTTRETLYPSKHRPSLKRSYISTTHSNLLELNPFAILLTSPKKITLPSFETPSFEPPSETPRAGMLLLQGVPPDTSL